ncbi:MAG: HAD family hydrolase [Planctomycetota bacterium]|jgi:FMN phosphatase YigB (HAD superfamily)
MADQPPEPPRAVLLDAGGVLLDETEHERLIADLVTEVLAGVVPGYSLARYHRDIEEAVATFCPGAYQYVVWKGVGGDIEAFDRVWTETMARWRDRKPELTLMPGIDREIRSLDEEFSLAIAGQYGGEILDVLRKHSLLDCFTSTLTQDDFEVTKPDPRFFEQLARSMRVEPERCIVVGDRIDKDVVPARQLGMKAVLVRVGLHRDQQPRIPSEVPDVELSSVTGLADAVRALGAGS